MQINLIIFDLDGTLLNTLEDLGDSVNEALAAHQLPEHEYSDYCRFVGDGMEMLIRRSLPQNSPESVFSQVLANFREAYRQNWANKSRPYAGITEMLKALNDTRIPTAVLSNKPDEFTQLCVSKFFPNGCFKRAYGQRHGIPKKPDPGAATAIANELGIKVERTMYVGDSDVDIITGTTAGMLAVGVSWGFRNEEELRAAGATHILSKPCEILNLLQ